MGEPQRYRAAAARPPARVPAAAALTRWDARGGADRRTGKSDLAVRAGPRDTDTADVRRQSERNADLDARRQAGRVLLEQRGTAESLLADGGWQWRGRGRSAH